MNMCKLILLIANSIPFNVPFLSTFQVLQFALLDYHCSCAITKYSINNFQGWWKRSSCSGFGRTNFLQGKSEIPIFTKSKQLISKSASVIFGLVRFILLERKSISIGARLSAAHTLCLQGILLCKKLSIKQSGSVTFRSARLLTLQYN